MAVKSNASRRSGRLRIRPNEKGNPPEVMDKVRNDVISFFEESRALRGFLVGS